MTRRTVLASAATIGAATAATTSSSAAGSAPPTAPATAPATEMLQSVNDYIKARSQAANPGQALLSQRKMSQGVATFETERAAYMRSIGSRFDYDGRVVSLSSEVFAPQLVPIDANNFQISFYEATTMNWVPNPRAVPNPIEGELVQSKYGTPHILTLSRSGSGWAVTSDAYEERDLFGKSPDALRFNKSTLDMVTSDTQPAVNQPMTFTSSSPSVALDPPYNVYTGASAKDYAIQYALSYNAAYVNYNCSGGDCANFVSQAFWVGGQLPAGSWNRITTSSCGVSNKYGGSAVQWYNNASLRAWVNNQARGATAGSIGALAGGDIVNYDWDGGGTDHVAMVTKAAQQLVSCHNNDRQNVPWQLGGAQSYIFTAMFAHY